MTLSTFDTVGPLVLIGITFLIIVGSFVGLWRAYREYDREIKRTLDTYRRYRGG